MKLTDESTMPYGKYQGVKMADVPAEYLLWLNENKRWSWEVKDYILENLDVLQEQVKRNKSQTNK